MKFRILGKIFAGVSLIASLSSPINSATIEYKEKDTLMFSQLEEVAKLYCEEEKMPMTMATTHATPIIYTIKVEKNDTLNIILDQLKEKMPCCTYEWFLTPTMERIKKQNNKLRDYNPDDKLPKGMKLKYLWYKPGHGGWPGTYIPSHWPCDAKQED